MKTLANIHPEETLQFEFAEPQGISAYSISKDLKTPQTRISQRLKENQSIIELKSN